MLIIEWNWDKVKKHGMIIACMDTHSEEKVDYQKWTDQRKVDILRNVFNNWLKSPSIYPVSMMEHSHLGIDTQQVQKRVLLSLKVKV